MSDKSERPQIDPSQTYPKKKGLLPPLSETPDIKRGNPTVIQTKEVLAVIRTNAELVLAMMIHNGANQPGLNNMTAEELAESIEFTFTDTNSKWIGTLDEQQIIKNSIIRARKDRDNLISYPKKFSSELQQKLSGEITPEVIAELFMAITEFYS